MSYWGQTLLPMFRDYLRDQYLCDLWFVCDGGALVPCHKLINDQCAFRRNLFFMKNLCMKIVMLVWRGGLLRSWHWTLNICIYQKLKFQSCREY